MAVTPYTYAGLTLGERLWVARRRTGLPLADTAVAYGVGTWRYGEWEHDRGDAIPWAHLKGDRLTSGERCALARRRAGWSLDRLAAETGWSRVTLIKWEANARQVGNPLAGWWDARGWPAKAA